MSLSNKWRICYNPVDLLIYIYMSLNWVWQMLVCAWKFYNTLLLLICLLRIDICPVLYVCSLYYMQEEREYWQVDSHSVLADALRLSYRCLRETSDFAWDWVELSSPQGLPSLPWEVFLLSPGGSLGTIKSQLLHILLGNSLKWKIVGTERKWL